MLYHIRPQRNTVFPHFTEAMSEEDQLDHNGKRKDDSDSFQIRMVSECFLPGPYKEFRENIEYSDEGNVGVPV